MRELAGQLSLAVNTVARAYRELEAAGMVETRGRFGTFVARADPADAAMATAANAYVDDRHGAGRRQGRRRCATSKRRSTEATQAVIGRSGRRLRAREVEQG